jgi:hypothetical protein
MWHGTKGAAVTEQDWLECPFPFELIRQVQGDASDRKLRLFACACYRLNWHSIVDGCARNAVSAAEHYADGLISFTRLIAAGRSSHEACWHLVKTGEAAAWDVVQDVVLRPYANDEDILTALWPMAQLFRDIVSNPFRPVALSPRWQTSTVLDLARLIYDERAFDRLPILADALMDAGCDNDDILAHCRGDGPHVRGCWVVDLILGKT